MSYFWGGDKLDDFLFKGLDTKSWAGLSGICIGLLSLALLYEGLHLLKQFFLNRFLKIRKDIRATSIHINENNRVPSSETSSTSRNRRRVHDGCGDGEPAPRSLLEETESGIEEDAASKRARQRQRMGMCSNRNGFLDLCISSVLHSIYVCIGFTLMNAVMTFNVWVMIAICCGIGLGYFFFGNYRRTDHLMYPHGTETTSLNESESAGLPYPGPGGDAGTVVDQGSRFVDRENTTIAPNKNQQGPSSWVVEQEPTPGQDPSECSRLIVGAEVHTPRIMSSSTSSN